MTLRSGMIADSGPTVGDLGQSVETVYRGNHVASFFGQQVLSTAPNGFAVVDHQDLYASKFFVHLLVLAAPDSIVVLTVHCPRRFKQNRVRPAANRFLCSSARSDTFDV